MKAGAPTPAEAAALGARADRLSAALIAAHEGGELDGERIGYRAGWRWGFFCGTVFVAVVATLAVTL